MRHTLIQPVRTAVSSEVCDYLDIQRQTLTQLNKAGILPFAKNNAGEIVQNRYHLRNTVVAYVQFLKARAKEAPGVSAAAYDAAKTARMDAEAGISARRLGMMEGTLMRTEDVDAEVLEVIHAIRSKMLGFPAWVEPLLDGKPREERIQLSTQYMEEALSDLSRLEDTEKLHGDILGRNRKLQAYAEGFDEDESGENGGGLSESTPQKPRGRPRKASAAELK